MKVGIVTLTDYSNYGNRLQHLAVYKIVEKLGYQPECLWIDSKEHRLGYTNNPCKRLFIRLFPISFIIALKKIRRAQETLFYEREKHFKQFSEKYLPITRRIYVRKNSDLKNKISGKEYGYFITGSDQVWNPYFAGDDYLFLNFAEQNKRIAFAASIGVEHLPEQAARRYKPLLEQMHYISVREDSAAILIKRITGRNVDVLLDPTLLLERQEWEKIIEKPDIKLPSRYIVAFFLGQEPIRTIQKFAKKTGLHVIHLNQKTSPEYFAINPSEFLYLIKHAEYVLTDSFHGTVFSIKFERQFYVFHRHDSSQQNMFSRIRCILDKFSLQDREQTGEEIAGSDIMSERWRDIEKVIEMERKRTFQILKNVLAKQDEV